MSQENVEFVRRWYESLPDLRDADPADDEAFVDRAFREYLDENWELRLPPGYPEGEPVFRGREGFAQLAVMLRDVWSEWRFEPEHLLDVGDRVVVFVRVIATGGASGVPIELADAHVLTIRDGRIRSSIVYRDRADALQAVGLSEQDAHADS